MNNLFRTLAISSALFSASVSATPMLNFIIDGDTYSQEFSITNASDAGETVTRFQLDLRTSDSICFDPSGDATCNSTSGVSFAGVGGTGALTGLIAGVVTNEAGGVDAWDYLDITFADFNSGETFSWDIDVDHFTGTGSATVYGNELIGATAYVDFSSGIRLIGELAAVAGNADASAFTVTGTTTISVPEPGVLALIGLGLLGATTARRKAKN